MAIGQYKEIKGSGQTEIIDMPIYQHLSRSRNTLVIGKIIDSQLLSPVHNVTVQASMSGYQCGKREVIAGPDGIFQIDFPHLRNNYPYSVEFKITSNDNSYEEITKSILIGGVLRLSHLYLEIPMNSVSRAPVAQNTYQSYVIDS